MTKILYIIPAEGFGGAERQAILHIRNLPSYGIKVLSVTGPGRKVLDQLPDPDHSALFCPFFPHEYGKPFRIFPFLRHLFCIAISWLQSLHYMITLLRKEKVDLIFASRVAGWSLAAPLALLFGIPDIWRFGSRVQGGFRRMALKGLGIVFRPSAVVSNCNAVAESIQGIVNAPVYLVPNGIDVPQCKAHAPAFDMREMLDVHPDIPLIGLAVRPSPDKGMDFLAAIVKQCGRYGCAAHFCIAGDFGWRERIQEDFKRQGIDKRVRFLGHLGDMTPFYCGCDLIALTSRERSIEGFPNALLEAMAQGRPVIATAVGGIPELIEHDKTGILIKQHDPALFAREIIRLLTNPAKRDRLGYAARNAVRERYSADATVGLLANHITSVSAMYKNRLSMPEFSVSTHAPVTDGRV